MQQRTLHRLFLRCFRDIYRLHRARVDAGVIHRGGQRAGGGVEVLHLLGHVADAVEVLREHDRVVERRAGVRAHQIRHKILLAAELLVDACITFAELLVDVKRRLAHIIECIVAHVLRRDLELARNVMLNQFLEEGIVPVRHHIVVAQTRADENLLDTLDPAQLAQQVEVIRVVSLNVAARRWEQTALVLAAAVRVLLFAGREAEIRRRTADIMDIALEAGHLGDFFRFLDDALVAAHLNVASLMERKCAEIARTEAASVVNDRELNLLNGRNTAECLVGRVVGAHIGQRINVIHLLGGQRLRGRVLYKDAPAVALKQRPAAHGILLVILELDRTGVVRFARADILVGRALDRIPREPLGVVRHVGCAAHADARICAFSAVPEIVRKLNHRMFAHAVHHTVRAGRLQNGGHDAVSPVVVVRKAPQARLDAAEIDRRIGEGTACEHGIDGDGAVGTFAALAAGGIGIVRAAFFRGGIVRDHRVNIAAVDEHRIARPSHREKIMLIAEIRLTEDRDLIACVLEYTGNDRRTE